MELPLALPWIAFAIAWTLFGAATVGVHRLLRGRLARLDAGQHAALLFALGLFPLLVSISIVVLGFAPAVGGLVVDRHCHPGTGCMPHVPVLHADTAVAVPLLLGLLAATAGGAAALWRRLRRGATLARALAALAAHHTAPDEDAGPGPRDLQIVETAERFAYCSGLLRSRLFVSRGLLDALSPREMRAVIAHEHTHAIRCDNLRRLLASIGLCAVPAAWRRPLLEDLALATEIVCDREAAERTGSIETVVDAIRTVTGRRAAAPARPGFSFTHGTLGRRAIDTRIAALREPVSARVSRTELTALALGSYLTLVLPATYGAHHVAERLLGG